jgi:hypothetical protein
MARTLLCFSRWLKNFVVQAAQKDLRGEAREKIGERRRTYPVRWSEPIERNEAYESFSAAC